MRLKTTLVALLALFFTSGRLFAQTNAAWTPVPNTQIGAEVFEQTYKPAVFKAFQLDEQAIRNAVAAAPLEGTVALRSSPVIISIPNAAGALERFQVVESPVMEQGLADRYQTIKTYLGVGLDHNGSTVRFDLTPLGFNAMVLSPDRKTIYVNVADHAHNYYVVFDRDGLAAGKNSFACSTYNDLAKSASTARDAGADDGKRRTFRLAVTVNGEFSQACLDGTETTDAQRKAKVLAVLTTDLNRANGIFDRDFGIRMNYVANMDLVLFLDITTDPFPTNQANWNNLAQSTITTNIGSANFDVGHFIAKVFSAGQENGNAGCIGCVCNNSSKASGYTAHRSTLGDPLVVDYWCHEMGHQFGANHTFSFNPEGTGANMEPGSGSTIMGYAGITGSYDVQSNADDYFHSKSIDQVTTYIKSAGGGGSCAVVTNTGNTAPTANAGADYTIPMSTPFLLTGQGSDVNAGDVLSYTWEQYDTYTGGSSAYPTATSSTGPLFRSKIYSASNQRVFPELATILIGSESNAWEALPGIGRPLNFRFTVRDNSSLGGANNSDDVQVTVDGTTGPFKVTSPNSGVTWKVGEFQTVTWDVAGTTGGGVNCANVTIELSTDGGNTFPITLAANTPNDGSQEITVPNNLTTQARVRVKAVGNIFFDISNADFTIQNATIGDFVFNTPDPVRACAGSSLSATLNTASLASYNTPITLSAVGNPAGSTVVFTPATVTPGSNVTVSLTGTVAAGSYTVAVTGVSGSITKKRNITFFVVSPSASASLSTPANNAIAQSTYPTFSWTAIPGADSYTVEVASSASFTPVVVTKTGITASNYTLASPLNATTQYFWRVKAATACGTLTSSSFNFTTSAVSCSTFVSADVPKAISSVGTATVNSTLTVSQTGSITDVDVVGLQGTHTYISDITAAIKSPSNTSVVLFDQVCTSEQDFNLNLDDAAASGTFPCPPTGGITRRPQQVLSAFNGQPVNGTWTLTITDNWDQDGGSLNGWGLRFCITGGTLPVSWLDFTARRNGEKSVLLEWSTASELNNKYYVIERSSDGTSYVQIGTINAGTNPSGVQHYVFNDAKPFAGVNYYRLRQVDISGQYKYSSVERVTIAQDKNVYALNPNPATSRAVLSVFRDMKQANIDLIDVTGKKVFTAGKALIRAGEHVDIPVSNLAKGYYLVVITSGTERFTEKLVVQ